MILVANEIHFVYMPKGGGTLDIFMYYWMNFGNIHVYGLTSGSIHVFMPYWNVEYTKMLLYTVVKVGGGIWAKVLQLT